MMIRKLCETGSTTAPYVLRIGMRGMHCVDKRRQKASVIAI
jgi:hypothetical protein